ncbi:MAG: helix-turn-helix domain-containing protein [Pseudomonadota bacterium]
MLDRARALFWARGYSHVSLREIASEAGVDVALVSRYFGSKKGLFEETIHDLPSIDAAQITDADALVEAAVVLFTEGDHNADQPSPTTFILHNAGDSDVGEAVRRVFHQRWQTPIEQILRDKSQAARFTAAIFGLSVAEKTLQLEGFDAKSGEGRAQRIRAFLKASLAPTDQAESPRTSDGTSPAGKP